MRIDLAELLEENGIKSVHYNVERYVPPIALVVPDENYLSIRPGDRFGEVNVAVQIIIIGGRTSTELASMELFDDMILMALKVLNDAYDVISVTPPREVTVSETTHYASIITVEDQIKL